MATRERVALISRSLFVLAGVVAIAALSRAVWSSSRDQADVAISGTESGPSVIRRDLASSFEGMPLTTLAHAAEQIGSRVRIPLGSLVGDPVSVTLVASFAEDPGAPAKDEQGLMVYYDKDVLYSAQPLGKSPGPDFGASAAVAEDDALQWEDGRKDAYTVARINGHDAMIQPGGVKVDTRFNERHVVNAAVVWVEDGVEYALESETLPVSALQAIAEKLSRQQ